MPPMFPPAVSSKTADAWGTRAQIAKGVVRFASLDDLRSVLEHEETVARRAASRSPVWQVVESVSNDRSPWHACEFVDTPGISQTRWQSAGQESLDDFYHRADVVVWLLVADKVNSHETRRGLESMSRYGKPVIGVVNRADMLPPEYREHLLQQVRGRFDGLLQERRTAQRQRGQCGP